MHMDDSERCDPKVTGRRVLRLDTQSVAYPAIHMGDVDVGITSSKMFETTTQAADDRSPLLRGCIRGQERIWAGRTINKQEGDLPLVLPCIGKPVPPGYPGIACEQLERDYLLSSLSSCIGERQLPCVICLVVSPLLL